MNATIQHLCSRYFNFTERLSAIGPISANLIWMDWSCSCGICWRMDPPRLSRLLNWSCTEAVSAKKDLWSSIFWLRTAAASSLSWVGISSPYTSPSAWFNHSPICPNSPGRPVSRSHCQWRTWNKILSFLICLSKCLLVGLSVCSSMSVSHPFWLTISRSVFNNLCIYLSFYLPFFLSFYLSIFLSVYSSICL